MSIFLSDVLKAIGCDTKQQIGLTKLIAWSGNFDKDQKGKIISDKKAAEYLTKPFATMDEGIDWLFDVMTKKIEILAKPINYKQFNINESFFKPNLVSTGFLNNNFKSNLLSNEFLNTNSFIHK